MRRISLMLAVALFSNSAKAVEPWKYPDQADHMGWVSFCEGVEGEVARQATTTDNRTQYDHAGNNQRALVAELVVVGSTMKPVYPEAQMTYWENQGANVAGNQFWDSAPLFDDKSHTGAETRNLIIANRSKTLQICDAMAVQSSVYYDRAIKMLKDAQRKEQRAGQDSRISKRRAE